MGSCSSNQRTLPHSITLLKRGKKDTISESRTTEKPKIFLQLIDHVDTFINSEFSFIEGIKFCYGDYIKGMQVCYSVNLQKKTMNLMGSGTHKFEKIVRFEEGEHIDSLVLYHDEVALTAIKLTTTLGREEFIGGKFGENILQKEINLRAFDKVVLGFRGLVGEYLKDLEVYETQAEIYVTQKTEY